MEAEQKIRAAIEAATQAMQPAVIDSKEEEGESEKVEESSNEVTTEAEQPVTGMEESLSEEPSADKGEEEE